MLITLFHNKKGSIILEFYYSYAGRGRAEVGRVRGAGSCVPAACLAPAAHVEGCGGRGAGREGGGGGQRHPQGRTEGHHHPGKQDTSTRAAGQSTFTPVFLRH